MKTSYNVQKKVYGWVSLQLTICSFAIKPRTSLKKDYAKGVLAEGVLFFGNSQKLFCIESLYSKHEACNFIKKETLAQVFS